MARLETVSTCIHKLELNEEERTVILVALRHEYSHTLATGSAVYHDVIVELIDVLSGDNADG